MNNVIKMPREGRWIGWENIKQMKILNVKFSTSYYSVKEIKNTDSLLMAMICLQFLNFVMVWKWYTFSWNDTLDFDLSPDWGPGLW